MPARFDSQLAIVAELVDQVRRMERGEARPAASSLNDYERELRLAGLAQLVAQSYTVIEGVLAFVARRIDRTPLAGADWHKKLLAQCARAGETRPALLSTSLCEELLELCEFRHVARNIYATKLDKARVRANLDRLARVAPAFQVACRTFAAALAPEPRKTRKRSRKIVR